MFLKLQNHTIFTLDKFLGWLVFPNVKFED
jgi:hypothetical protein